MRLGYTIIYVPDVATTVEFYERAFGLQRRFVHESGLYAEMATGETTLSFAGESTAELNGVAIRPNSRSELSAGFEICLVTDAPEQGYSQAVGAGALALKAVETKPWGQRVGYVRDINGCLVEICSPMAG